MALHSTRDGIECSFPSIQNRMLVQFLQEWSVYSILAGMEWSHSIPAEMEYALKSCRNGMTTPFLQEWNDLIPFQPEWNDHSIPAGMGCHFTRNLKIYAIIIRNSNEVISITKMP